MVPFAWVEDLEARFRPLSADEKTTAEALIADSSQLIVDEAGDVSAVDENTLIAVVCAMVKRAMAVPGGDGVVSLQHSAGPFQQTRQFSNPTGDLYLTRAEKRRLGIGRQTAAAINLLGGG